MTGPRRPRPTSGKGRAPRQRKARPAARAGAEPKTKPKTRPKAAPKAKPKARDEAERPAERRRSPRVRVEMWVEEIARGEVYHHSAADLSLGGMLLERVVPHPEGTVVRLRFVLPGEELPIRVVGRVVKPREQDQAYGMGVEFVQLDPATAQRIARFVRAQAAESPAGSGPSGPAR